MAERLRRRMVTCARWSVVVGACSGGLLNACARGAEVASKARGAPKASRRRIWRASRHRRGCTSRKRAPEEGGGGWVGGAASAAWSAMKGEKGMRRVPEKGILLGMKGGSGAIAGGVGRRSLQRGAEHACGLFGTRGIAERAYLQHERVCPSACARARVRSVRACGCVRPYLAMCARALNVCVRRVHLRAFWRKDLLACSMRAHASMRPIRRARAFATRSSFCAMAAKASIIHGTVVSTLGRQVCAATRLRNTHIGDARKYQAPAPHSRRQ
eukprot:5213905-Pleurochrysis_carterae.AAC.1